MARVSHDRVMKDMVIRVKELCKDVDDSSVQILLQQYDFNIDHTVQAILDGSAEETLQEWKSTGASAKMAAAKKKKKNRNKSSAQNHESTNGSLPVQNVNHVMSNTSGLCNGSVLPDAKSSNGAFLSEAEYVEPQEHRLMSFDQPSHKHSTQQSRPKEDYKQQTKKGSRDRTLSEASTSSGIEKAFKSPHAGLEKSLKDLQRQTVSLQRLKVVLHEQVDKSFKRISEVFKELHNQLNEREAELIFSMDKVKMQANNVLEEQQQRALELKHQTDRAQIMKDSELVDLRSRIKSFVSDRKRYEDLSHSQRFVCDFSHILEELKKFGEVVPVKIASEQRPPSVVSLGSSVSHEEVSLPSQQSTSASLSSLTHQTNSSNHQSSACESIAAATTTTTAAAASTSSAVPSVFVPNSAHVLMQSESLTKYEATEMAQRLANLALSDSKLSSTSSKFRNPRSERGRGSRGRGFGYSGANTDRSAVSNSDDQSRETQLTQGGRGRGSGRGQSRSYRGEGESSKAGESLTNDDQRSYKSKGTNAHSSANSSEAHDRASSNAISSKQSQMPKPSDYGPHQGGRRGGRHDNHGGRSSGDSLPKSDAGVKPIHEPTVNHDNSHDDTGKSFATNNNDIVPSSNKPVSEGLTNGQANALPQRGTRSNRRGGGNKGEEILSMENQEPVLANGE